jgi:hypothetical protein
VNSFRGAVDRLPGDPRAGNTRAETTLAREVTAADIDFCDGMESWQTAGAMATLRDERWLWSQAFSDEVQTGLSSPHFYSILQFGMTRLKWLFLQLVEAEEWLGYPKERFQDIPMYLWYGARAYYNAQFERERDGSWLDDCLLDRWRHCGRDGVSWRTPS